MSSMRYGYSGHDGLFDNNYRHFSLLHQSPYITVQQSNRQRYFIDLLLLDRRYFFSTHSLRVLYLLEEKVDIHIHIQCLLLYSTP